ncbi:MAG TPA: surface-adhesin E family protein [Longimicrobium sp.]|jgi:hypothetical protein
MLVVPFLLGACASRAAAPETPARWQEVHHVGGAAHSIDVGGVVPLGPSRYRVLYRMSLASPTSNPAGQRFDRLQGLKEYDCEQMRERSLTFEMYSGERRIQGSRDPGEWETPSGPAGDVLRAVCATLAVPPK